MLLTTGSSPGVYSNKYFFRGVPFLLGHFFPPLGCELRQGRDHIWLFSVPPAVLSPAQALKTVSARAHSQDLGGGWWLWYRRLRVVAVGAG